MNKPIKKEMVLQPGTTNEAIKRTNLINIGFNKACDEWEKWLLSKSNETKKIKRKVNETIYKSREN